MEELATMLSEDLIETDKGLVLRGIDGIDMLIVPFS